MLGGASTHASLLTSGICLLLPGGGGGGGGDQGES